MALSPFVLATSPQDLDPLGFVDDDADLDLLRRMIQTRSYSGGGEEGTLARWVADEMEGLGLETIGIEAEGRFPRPDEHLRLMDNVYVAGDPAGPCD